MRIATLLAILAIGGCAGKDDAARRLLPDRFGLGVTLDAETYEAKTLQANLFWDLRPGK